MKTIGVLGLGIIGGVWARHYDAAGVLAGAWNRTPQPTFPQWKESPEAVTEAADVIQIVVADPPAVSALLERIKPALHAGKIVVQSSTIDPDSSETFHRLVTATGARYLEAPFTGSKPAAEQKQSVYYLGGDAGLIAEVEPLLALGSAARLHIGDHRQATALKLAMNLNIAGLMESLAEALTLTRRSGVPDDTFFSAMSRNVGHSGLVALKEPKLRANDFSPQFSVKHLAKDLRLAAGITYANTFPMLQLLRDRWAAAEKAGMADEDFAAVIKLL